MFDANMNTRCRHLNIFASTSAKETIRRFWINSSKAINISLGNQVQTLGVGRFVSSYEAAWHGGSWVCRSTRGTQPSPTWEYTWHLPNGQLVYFTEETLQVRVTTPTAFLQLCQNDAFAKILIYIEVPQYYYRRMHSIVPTLSKKCRVKVQ